MRPEPESGANRRRRAVRLLAAVAGEHWGWLGVRIRDLSEQEMEEITKKVGVQEGYGVLISQVMKDTPAEAAGLREGDLVVAIDGRPIVETRALQRLVGATAAGRELGVVVLRDRERRELRVLVGTMPSEAVADRVVFEFGFYVRDEAEIRAAGAPAVPVVAGVAERSSASQGGLRAGDRILAINGVDVETLEAFRQRAQDLYLRDPMRLRVERDGETVSLTLLPAQSHLQQ